MLSVQLYQAQGIKISGLAQIGGPIAILEVPSPGTIIEIGHPPKKEYRVEFVVFVADPPPPAAGAQQIPVKLVVSEVA
jgi:hypothetical protein